MRFLTFSHNGTQSWGVRTDQGVSNIGERLQGRFPSLRSFIGDPKFEQLARETIECSTLVQEDEITFLPPIPDPDKIICVGLNYEEHRVETNHAPTGFPTLFTRFAASQCGHGAPIMLPTESRELDYEAELVAVIGKPCFKVSEGEALSNIVGYSCYNDGSIRDWQTHTTQFLPGKNFISTGAFGPYLVTKDEVGDPQDLAITCRLNGQIVQSARTDQMIHNITSQISYISRFTPLVPGDLIVTGTPGGVGFTRSPQLFMKAGDLVEVEIENVGQLKNPIVAEA